MEILSLWLQIIQGMTRLEMTHISKCICKADFTMLPSSDLVRSATQMMVLHMKPTLKTTQSMGKHKISK